MCLGIPGRILELKGNKGIVEFAGMKRAVFMQLIPDAEAGNYVLVHAGCAIEKIDEEEALKTLEILRELSEHEVCG